MALGVLVLSALSFAQTNNVSGFSVERLRITPDRSGGRLRIKATAATTAPTGVEMEAMTACAVAALTVYDMVKGADRTAEIRNLRLLEKSGGKSGEWHRPPDPEGTERPRGGVPKGARGPQRRG